MPLSPPSPGFPAMDSPCLQLALGTAGCSKACWAAGQLGFIVQSFALPAALSLDPGHAVVSVGKPLSLTLDLKCKINPISSLISTCFGTEILGVDTLSCSWHRVGLGSCTQICTELLKAATSLAGKAPAVQAKAGRFPGPCPGEQDAVTRKRPGLLSQASHKTAVGS